MAASQKTLWREDKQEAEQRSWGCRESETEEKRDTFMLHLHGSHVRPGLGL